MTEISNGPLPAIASMQASLGSLRPDKHQSCLVFTVGESPGSAFGIFRTSPTQHGPRESGGPAAGGKWNRAKCCAGAVAGGRETRPRTWPTRGQLALSPPAMTLANAQ